MNRAPDVGRAVFWSLVRTWGGRLVGFAIYFQLARLLSPADIGLFAAGFALLVLMELLVDQGMMHAVVQRAQVSEKLLNAVFLANLGLALLLALVMGLAAPHLERWMAAPGLGTLVLVCSGAVVVTALGMCQEALARKALDFHALALRTLVSTTLSGAVALALAFGGYGVWALVAQFVLASVLNTAMLWLRPRWWPTRGLDLRGLRSLLGFGVSVLAARLVGYAGTRGLDLMIGLMLGPVALGLFSVGSKLQYICLQLLGSSLVDVAFPAFSRLQGQPERLRRAHAEAVQSVSMLAMPLWALMLACAPEAVALAFGERWLDAVPVLQGMALVGAMQVLNQFDVAALNASGRPARSFQLGLARSLTVLLALGLAWNLPLELLIWVMVGAQLLVMPLYFLALRAALGTTWIEWLAAVAPAWGGALLLLLVVDQLRTHWPALAAWPAPLRLLCLAALGLAAYAAVLGLFARPQLRQLRSSLHDLRTAP